VNRSMPTQPIQDMPSLSSAKDHLCVLSNMLLELKLEEVPPDTQTFQVNKVLRVIDRLLEAASEE
jgi:hypothetical protein